MAGNGVTGRWLSQHNQRGDHFIFFRPKSSSLYSLLLVRVLDDEVGIYSAVIFYYFILFYLNSSYFFVSFLSFRGCFPRMYLVQIVASLFPSRWALYELYI